MKQVLQHLCNIAHCVHYAKHNKHGLNNVRKAQSTQPLHNTSEGWAREPICAQHLHYVCLRLMAWQSPQFLFQ